ncbi:unnamed protein product [Candida verbasci]|uniref:DNA damage-binding protein CMR1 n=1 Tax=Candida verbasci TaxID=1227364 RepID=A0A9W4XF80_9ASCO|nr:unnamed protein product [Candida verbasci]
MNISKFERKRQENIQRNKDLLAKLNLDSISSSIKNEIKKSATPPPSKRSKPQKRVFTNKEESIEPTRRSKRIAGIKSETENPEEYKKLRKEEEEKEKLKREVERLKRSKLPGDYALRDLLTDSKGNMIFEDKIIKNEDSKKKTVIKKEEEEEEEGDDDEDLDVILNDDDTILNVLQSLGHKYDKLSPSDIYEEIKVLKSDSDIESKRKEFAKLKVYHKFDPLDIKICHNRITSIYFHPATKDRIIAAGDTSGNVGLWAVDASNENEPAITILHGHGRNVSKILTPDSDYQKIYTSAFDGTIRSLDLNKMSSNHLLYMKDPYEKGDIEIPITDFNIPRGNPNQLYITNMDGQFITHDVREPWKIIKKNLLRLHDKKIGGFSINPNNSNQIATSSLDRSLRIWDLRNIGKSIYSDLHEHQNSPHLYGNFTSRLSISTVDWNINDRLLCNGYDDTIRIFDMNGISEWEMDYVIPSKHQVEEGELPDNINSTIKINHNCQTGRWVSILKSKWQYSPKDQYSKFIIGNMKRGLDIYNQDGIQLGHLNELCGAVPAVCTLHPTENWAVGGSASGKLYFYE